MRAVRLVLCAVVSMAMMVLGLVPSSSASAPPSNAPARVSAPASQQPVLSKVTAPESAFPQSVGSSLPQLPVARSAGLMAQANLPGWDITLDMTVGTTVTLTATVNRAIQGNVLIYDTAWTGSSQVVKQCLSGTVCTVTLTPGMTQSSYVAIVGGAYADKYANYPAGSLYATSNTVTPPAWTITLTADISTTISLTATTNYAATGSKWITIYDTGFTGTINYLKYCNTGTTCSVGPITPSAKASSYLAVVGYSIQNKYSDYAESSKLRVSNTITPPPWTVDLVRNGNKLTATANYSASGTKYITIYDLSSTGSVRYVQFCNSGLTCTGTPNYPSHTFIATVGSTGNTYPPNPLFATSNQIGMQGPTSPYETAGGSNPAQLNDCYACVGDPINTSNGEFFETDDDITVPGRGTGLALSRTYSSLRAGIDGRFGFGWADPYGMSATELPDGRVLINQETGSRVVFTPAGAGAYTAPSHVLAKLVKNPNGTWTYTRRSREVFSFGTSGKLTETTDLNGNGTTLVWDSNGMLTGVTDSSGRLIAFTYGANGKVATAADPANRVVAYGYDSAGRLETVTLPGNRTTVYTYDASNRVTSMTDPRGSVTVNTYDWAGRVTKQTTGAGDLTLAYSGDGTDSVTTITSPGGRMTKETYRGGQLIKRIVGSGTPQQATWTYTYDPATFAKTSVKDPLNRTTSATYDARGNKLTATDGGGGTTTATYDALDNLLTSTNPAGTTTTYTYDSAGNRLTASTPLTGTSQTATISYTYGDAAHPGDLTGITDPNGHTTTFAHDANGNRTTTTDPLGRATTTAFDVLGRATGSTTPSGKTTTIAYSTAGYPVTITDPLGNVTTTTYDAGGNKTSVTDPMGRTTTHTYDALGRKTSTTAADTTVTATGYDADGNMTSQTDQASHVTSYAYDSRNRLTSSTDGLNRTTTYSYDAAGQLTGKTDPTNRTTTYTYNTAGDKTGTSYSDGVTPNESFTYTSLHQLATMTDGTGTTTNTYDSLGRLKSRTNGAGKNVAFAYDLAGNPTAQTYPNGHTVTKVYDAANNLTSLTDWLNNTTNFTTNTDGRPATISYANGITSTSAYNDNGLITGIDITNSAGSVASFGYTRNDNGNLSTATTAGITQPAETYTYTNRDELATVNTSAIRVRRSWQPHHACERCNDDLRRRQPSNPVHSRWHDHRHHL